MVLIENIKARLHSSTVRQLGVNVMGRWEYPENTLFSIQVSNVYNTVYCPNGVSAMLKLGNKYIPHPYLTQDNLDEPGDVPVILSADVVAYNNGTFYATNIRITEILNLF